MSEEAKDMLRKLRERYPWAPDEVLNVLLKSVGYAYDANDKKKLTIVSNDVRVLITYIEAALHERDAALEKLARLNHH